MLRRGRTVSAAGGGEEHDGVRENARLPGADNARNNNKNESRKPVRLAGEANVS